jgi:hypothetical protein
MENWQILLISIGVPLLVSGLYNFFWQRMTTGRQEKKEKLARHFNDLQNDALKPISDIVTNINIKNGYILTNAPESFDRIDSEQMECFQAHYTTLGDKWQKLAGKWPKQEERVGCEWTAHNEKVKAFEGKVEELLSERLTKAEIALPFKPYQVRQEVIANMTLSALLKSLYEQAQGELVTRDVSKATIREDSDFYTLEVGNTPWAAAKNRDIIEKCKSIFIDIQNSKDFKKEATSIIKDAKQIKSEFQELLSDLDKIRSRGFISKVPEYKFKAVKNCPICKELFY